VYASVFNQNKALEKTEANDASAGRE